MTRHVLTKVPEVKLSGDYVFPLEYRERSCGLETFTKTLTGSRKNSERDLCAKTE